MTRVVSQRVTSCHFFPATEEAFPRIGNHLVSTSTKWLVVGNRVRAAKTAAAAAAAVNKKLIGRMPRKAFFISLCTFEIYSLQ